MVQIQIIVQLLVVSGNNIIFIYLLIINKYCILYNRVDGIPHLAFITKSGEVQTSLIGAVPEKIVDSEISSLAKVSNN